MFAALNLPVIHLRVVEEVEVTVQAMLVSAVTPDWPDFRSNLTVASVLSTFGNPVPVMVNSVPKRLTSAFGEMAEYYPDTTYPEAVTFTIPLAVLITGL